MIKTYYRQIRSKVSNVQDEFWFRSFRGRRNIKNLGKLENRHLYKRCFIMGNGPSLLKSDLRLLNNEITIASNAQFLIWNESDFKPKYLTVEDKLVAEDRSKEINKIKGLTKIFPKDLSKYLKLDEDTLYINFLRDYDGFPRFSSDFNKQVYWGGTVSFLNMQLAYYLGCREIYLIGFDHSYKVPTNVVNYVITSDGDDVNHIHPDYFGNGYRWHDPNVARMELSYSIAKKFFSDRGVDIYNATVGGKLEIFDRVDFNLLFK